MGSRRTAPSRRLRHEGGTNRNCVTGRKRDAMRHIQPAYKAVGEHKEAQRLNNIDFGYSVFKLGANSSPIVGYAAKHGHAFPMRSIIPPAPGGPPKHAYDLFTQFVQPLAALIWRTHQRWQPAECAAAMERFKAKECYILTP